MQRNWNGIYILSGEISYTHVYVQCVRIMVLKVGSGKVRTCDKRFGVRFSQTTCDVIVALLLMKGTLSTRNGVIFVVNMDDNPGQQNFKKAQLIGYFQTTLSTDPVLLLAHI